MSDKPREQDPFKPQEPNIPGVTGNPARHQQTPESPRPATSQFRASTVVAEKIPAQKWLAIAALAIGLVSLALFLWKHSGAPSESQQIPAVLPVVDLPPAAPAQPSVALVVGPGPIATTAELAKPWSSKRFEFHDTQTADNLSAVVVHLPNGVYWAFSLREPFGTCELEYVTDLGKLQHDYGVRANHPMVGDPCNRTVFDLTRYGAGPNGAVRGAIVSGQAVRPPLAIEMKVRGKQIVATQLEH